MLFEASDLEFLHELDVVVDYVLREQNLWFFKGKKSIEYHVPTHRSNHSEHVTDPFNCDFFKILNIFYVRKLFCGSYKIYQEFELTSVCILNELIQHIVIFFVIWNFVCYCIDCILNHTFVRSFRERLFLPRFWKLIFYLSHWILMGIVDIEFDSWVSNSFRMLVRSLWWPLDWFRLQKLRGLANQNMF